MLVTLDPYLRARAIALSLSLPVHLCSSTLNAALAACVFVLKPTGTIYYSPGLAAEKPAGSFTDLLFFPAFLSLHFFSTLRLKTKLSLSPPLSFSLPPSTHPSDPSSFLRQQSEARGLCQRRGVKSKGRAPSGRLFTFGCSSSGRRVKGRHREERGGCVDASVSTGGPRVTAGGGKDGRRGRGG